MAASAASGAAAPDAARLRSRAGSLLASRTVMEGERKQVTVLFADVKGSMELLANRDPEEARRLLDPLLELMMEAVHHYDGTVNQVMGDGIMALFGAPLAREEHAVRACYAALRMQQSVRRHAEEVKRSSGVDVQVRIGLNSGEVVVRAIGSDLRMDYTAVGQSTHLAARMEQVARPGTIVLSSNTLALAEGFVQARPLGAVPIKGLSEPVQVYELTGAEPIRTRFDAAVVRGLTRFVGRDAELERLGGALERTRAGSGQVVAVIGEPGVGKSRLFFEFVHSSRTRGCRVLQAGSTVYGPATAYLPIVGLLRAYFEIDPGDASGRARAKVADRVLARDRSVELAPLLALLDLPVEDARWQALAPPQRRQRTLDAIHRLLQSESREQPVVLVVEDLHSSDSETRALLDALVDGLANARVLILANYRPEYRDPWIGKTYYTRMRIDPLGTESADALLSALLGNDATVIPLKRFLIERTEGNPFFLEESVRSLAETHVLVGPPGAYRLTGSLTNLQVPATVQAVLAARIDRLPTDQKRLLQTAAVIGEKVPLALLLAIAEGPREAAQQGLAHLETAGFLYKGSVPPTFEYLFRHGLTHQVAYESLLADRRRLFHARIVESLEHLDPERLGEHVDTLAHHAVRGEKWPKAAHYLRQAGLRATSRSAYREAVVYLEQALEALARLPESRESLTSAIDVRLELHTALLPLGKFDRMFEHLQVASTLAEAQRDQPRLGRISAYQTDYLRQIGDYRRATEAGERSLSIARASGDLSLEVATNIYLAHAHHGLGDYRRASDYLKANVEVLVGPLARERLGLPYVASVHSRTWLVFCHAFLGAFAEATVAAEEGLRIAEIVDHPLSLASACWGLGRLHLLQGNPAQAIPVLERGLALSRIEDARLLRPSLASSLGAAYLQAGRLDEALPLLEEALTQHAAMRRTAGQADRLIVLGRAYLRAGREDDAVQLARRALELARTHDERGHEAYALQFLGELTALAEGPAAEEGARWLAEASGLAHTLGMRPLEAQCLKALAALHARAGRRAEAARDLAAAEALSRQMKMA